MQGERGGQVTTNTRSITCDACQGSGRVIPYLDEIRCEKCKGHGQVEAPVCESCGGFGYHKDKAQPRRDR